MVRDAANLILQQKPSQTLLVIGREGQTYASVISKEIESTFAHTANILGKLEELGLVKFIPDGNDSRVKRVELTRKGVRASALVEDLKAVLEGKKTAARIKSGSRKKELSKSTSDLSEKLDNIQSRIELISKEALDGRQSISKEEYVRMGRRLGPYRRELGKIMENGDKKHVDRAAVLDKMIENVFEACRGLKC